MALDRSPYVGPSELLRNKFGDAGETASLQCGSEEEEAADALYVSEVKVSCCPAPPPPTTSTPCLREDFRCTRSA